ncbi:hypothetical protein [Methylocystis heyeri]|uniref:Uncharacterized protein n=1 Tax=Methylocystis heyeri TaxID=391905 RepID=A0A6B8KJK5_9HYPH|nr:hypothetical protein [Methylocystis heyeri]QGM46778.1 hypothetical protein H2LOC_014345 [Methylocystis heyeri]
MTAKILLAAIALAFSAGSAVAQIPPSTSTVSVTNTSKKGSLLIFPMINIDPGASADTIIEISNDQVTPVQVECYYVNEQKGRVGFGFEMSGKATVSWDVRTRTGDQIRPPPFPSYGDYPVFGGIYRGELVCFAVDQGATQQIAFNHLHGAASVLGVGGALKYSAWSFWALNAFGSGPAADNTVMGPPGAIRLDGRPNDYDACPSYNAASFMPNGATLGRLGAGGNYLAVASCNQDLRQDYQLHTTKLLFTVWNALEQSYGGSYYCVDSANFVPLIDNDAHLINPTNFDYKTLGTSGASVVMQGVASAECPTSVYGVTQNAGLLGVIASYVRIEGGNPALIGGDIHSAGTQPGFVYWDPASVVSLKPAAFCSFANSIASSCSVP